MIRAQVEQIMATYPERLEPFQASPVRVEPLDRAAEGAMLSLETMSLYCSRCRGTTVIPTSYVAMYADRIKRERWEKKAACGRMDPERPKRIITTLFEALLAAEAWDRMPKLFSLARRMGVDNGTVSGMRLILDAHKPDCPS